MALNKCRSIEKYIKLLEENPKEVKALCEDLFIHVTEFFRAPESYEAVRTQILPQIFNHLPANVPLRIWVPGCSTGQEVYSIAIMLSEYAEEKKATFSFQIFGTDISEEAVQAARTGFFTRQQVQGLTSERLRKYFDTAKDGYKIKKHLRENCIFSRHDVSASPPFAKIDMISCRNLLIYFEQELQQRVLPILHYALNKSGYLWLGRSEAPTGLSKLFSAVDKTNKIYTKNPLATPTKYGFRGQLTPENKKSDVLNSPNLPREMDQQKEIDRIIMSRFAPAGVVVNSELEILQVRGKTSSYLELPSGQPTYSLLKMVRPELVPAVRVLTNQAINHNIPARQKCVKYHYKQSQRAVDIEVTPVNPSAPPAERRYLTLFIESEVEKPTETKKSDQKKTGDAIQDDYVQGLLRELDLMREYQQTLAEGYEAAQEELTASNEELQSTLEEFQINNEELETAKEELQAANEELTTVNSELINRAEELAASEERFRLIIQSVKDYAIFMLDPEGRVATWNEGARCLYGFEEYEIIGHDYSKLYTQTDLRAGKPAHELDVARIEGRFEEEGIRLKKDGSQFYASAILSPIRDDSGVLRGFAKVTRDISERMKTERALHESEERFRQMISVVKDYAIFRLDPSGTILTWNQGAKHLKGYEESEIVGQHFSKFYSEDDIKRGKPSAGLQQALSAGRFEDIGWRLRKDGSRFWADVVITPIRDNDGKLTGFTKVTRDLTERKIMDDELQRARENLEERVLARTEELREAIRARDEFISVASHELKTPLSTLKLQAQVTKRSLSKGDKSILSEGRLVPFLDQIDNHVDRLHQLVEDMLDVTRLQRGTFSIHPEETNVSSLICEVVERFLPEFHKSNCDFGSDIEPDIVGTWDRYRMEQVVLNLLSNAAKYGARKPVHVAVKKQNGSVVLRVRDNGIGIPPEDQERIFERFERAVVASEVSGLGLGLYITKEILAAHQGTIYVESTMGQGSEFIVNVPLRPNFTKSHKETKDYEF